MTFLSRYEAWRERLAEALDGRYYDVAWLDYVVMNDRAMFWSTDNCALVAEIRYYPTGARDAFVICTAGDPIETRDVMVPILEDWGRSFGCLAIVGASREAWTRILKPAGFELYKSTMRKAL